MDRYQGSDQKTIDSELTALLTEELIGNEQFIDKVVAEQPNIAMRFVKKIQNLIKLFKMSGEKRAEYKVLTLAENMYLRSAYDHGRQNLIQIIEQGREDNKQVQVDEQNTEVGVDQTLALQYNKKEQGTHKKKGSYYSQFNTTAMQWAFSDKRKVGDFKVLYNADNNTWNKLIADNSESRYYIDITIEDTPKNAEAIRKLHDEVYNDNNGEKQRVGKSVHNDYARYWSCSNNIGDDNINVEEQDANGQSRKIYRGKSESDGRGNSKQGNRNKRAVDYHFNDDGSQIVTYSDGTKKKSYSLKDSQGNELTQQQAEYFRDSKVRDEQGNLLVVYHGSKAIFTKFDANKIGWNGKAEGHGFYFTDNKNFAQDYSDVNGQLLQGYLNIKKPLSNSKRTLTRKQIEKLIREIDPTGDDLLSNYSITNIRDYGTSRHSIWYESALKDALNLILPSVDTDSDVLAELINSGAGAEQVLKIAYDNFGYDGYIVKNKYKDTNVFVAFDSSQFKNIDNLNPTSNQDIRYSKKADDEFSAKNKKLKEVETSLETTTDIEFSKPIDGYPYDVRKVISGYIDAVDNTLLEHAEECKKNKSAKFFRDKICDVSNEMATIINREFGIDVSNYSININTNGYNHIESRHGENGTQDHSMADIRDVARIGYVIENYDTLTPLKNKNGEQIYSQGYYRSDNTLAPLVIFSKKINGTYFCSVAAVDSKYKKMWVETAFINKKGLTYASNVIMTPDSTPEHAHNSRPFNNSISKIEENVNTDDKNTTKYSRKSHAPSQVGDIIKAKGNLTTDKIFTKDEAKKIIAEIEERLVFEDKGKIGTVKGTNELIDRLWKGLNKADKGEYTRVGVEIADYVIKNSVVEDIYECLYGDVEVDEARQVIKTLKQYFHKIKISDRVLGEIKHHFDDKASKVLSLWRAKEGGLADKINNDTKSQTVLAFILQ